MLLRLSRVLMLVWLLLYVYVVLRAWRASPEGAWLAALGLGLPMLPMLLGLAYLRRLRARLNMLRAELERLEKRGR